MNTYYELLKHLKATFDEDSRVSNVVTGDFEEWRKDVFLLVHLDVNSSPLINLENTSTVRFVVDVNVLDIRDVNKEDIKDRFWHNDNRHDAWNDTFSVLLLARNKLIKDHLDNNITISEVSAAERVTYAYGNGLDGWSQTLTIDVPDNFTSICYDQ